MTEIEKNSAHQELCLEEVCEITLLSAKVIIELVEYGIVEPVGETPDSWRFNTKMLTKTKKAVRLHKDLDIDWPGIALALSLIDELQELRETNRALEQRINRFYQWRR